MATVFLVGALLLLSVGCTTPPRVMPFPALGLNVIQADPASVKKVCDNTKALACAFINRRPCEIYIGYDSPRSWTHELRHCERAIAGERDDTHDDGGAYDW